MALTSLAPGSPPKISAPQQALLRLGLRTPLDFALHLPLRYEDETAITPLAEALGHLEGKQGGGEPLPAPVQLLLRVVEAQVQYRPRRQLVVACNEAGEAGETGETPGSALGQSVTLRFMNFYPSQLKTFATGSVHRVLGSLRHGYYGPELVHPSCKPVVGSNLAGSPNDTGLPETLTPIYPSTAGLAQPYLRKAIATQLARVQLPPTLPVHWLPTALMQGVERHAAQQDASQSTTPAALQPSIKAALMLIHQPPKDLTAAEREALLARTHPAWLRLKAEELLAQQLSQTAARAQRQAQAAQALPPLGGEACAALLNQFGFALTAAQQRVQGEIAHDLAQAKPMYRLLQGDVGCGKTAVAALAALQCLAAGQACAILVPTELLARQHARNFERWFAPLGYPPALLLGSQKTAERRTQLGLIASGAARLMIGTHALLQDSVSLPPLALVAIDEQHRFGVAQRLALKERTQAASGAEPHLLMMSATPIPRTLAMSYYADLDVSNIDQLPPNRTPVLTKALHVKHKAAVLARLGEQIAAGRQVYWVCPLIEESEKLDLQNATTTHAELSAALFPHAPERCALLHSKLKDPEKQRLMAEFVAGRVDLLVSTTVIEVGVDVPNATLMVIEHAERFGLAQLHQLRGRVGRGAAAAACVLLYTENEHGVVSQTAKARLHAMTRSNDGFEIARLDLEIRGAGDYLGTRQSGADLLKFGSPDSDAELLAWAHKIAPLMASQTPELAAAHRARWVGGGVDFSRA